MNEINNYPDALIIVRDSDGEIDRGFILLILIYLFLMASVALCSVFL